MADGIEARLIEAEAQLQASDFGGMTTTLNDLRRLSGPRPRWTSRATHDEATDLLFSERASGSSPPATAWATCGASIRQYGRRPGDASFPAGAYHKGGSYGTDVNLPLPIEEAEQSELSGVSGSKCVEAIELRAMSYEL